MSQGIVSCATATCVDLIEEVLNDVIEDPWVEKTAEAVKESFLARLEELVD
jgi:hypothetical protein